MKKWIRNVNRKNWTPTKHSRLCAHHFTPDCFTSRPTSNRVLLIPSAVPTIFYPRCLTLPKTKPRCTRTSLGIKASVASAGIPAELPDVNHDHDYLSYVAQPVGVDSVGSTLTDSAVDSVVDPVGSTADHPRPLRSPDELLQRTRNKLVSARKAAKIHQQKIRRLERKVKALSSLTTELKRKLLFSCSRDVEAAFGGVAKEILIRAQQNSKNVSVSDDLKHFAVTLHSYSPKAYEFVRESFGCVLPHAQTVKFWCRAKKKHAETGEKGSDPKPDTQVGKTPNSDAGIDMSAASAEATSNSFGDIFSEQQPAESWVFIPVSEAPTE